MATTGETTREAVVLDVLRHVLGAPDLDLDDNFFAAGGDSIVALTVIAEAAAAGLDLDLLDLLTGATIRDLAAAATVAGPKALGGPGLTDADRALVPAGVAAVRRASALQVGLLYLSELAEGTGAYLDFLGVRVSGALDGAALRAALARVLDRHEVLRGAFDLATYSVAAQVVHAAVPVPLEVADLANRDEEATIAAWRTHIMAEGLDTSAPPALRCHALAAGDHFRLSLATHHSIVDGWSYARLLVDLLHCYDAALRGAHPDLRAVPADGHDEFVRLEQAALAAPATARFWAERAREAHAVRRPADVPAANPAHRLAFVLDDDVWRRLRAAADELRVPVKSLCLAAHAWALGRWHGQDHAVTGLVTNGRPEVDGADQLVGLFLNTLPVTLPARGDWPELAAAALRAERLLTPHRRFPLAEITSRAGGPTFDVTFNFTHFHLYRELDQLRRVRADRWWSRDHATFPLLVNVFDADRELGTGATVAFDPDLVAPDRAEELRALLEEGLHAAARSAS